MNYLIKSLKILFSFIIILTIGAFILFFHRDISLDKLKLKYANIQSSFISVKNIDIHYRDEGNQTDSIPIILIHGTGASLHTFDDWTNKLKYSKRVIRLDLPAYGLTGPFVDRDYSILNYTSFLKEFLETLDIKQCIIAGNSLGGEIAWNFALEKPDIVKKLILINSGGFPSFSKSVPIAFRLAQTPVINKVVRFITPFFIVKSSVENVYFDKSKVTDSLVERYFDLCLREGNRQAFIDRLGIGKRNNYINISNIKQPTLILWGADDLLIPVENAYKFQNSLPNNKLVILENSGHVPMEENPFESIKHVIEFLNTP
ncbi:MAG: 2-hydroxymuconate semialdehyde hydrolase [Flavobacteriaceae bacterium]|nr:MAG: 2-hydroxymuconate semialdehyde hydrolase [Flavobacteriaceae bacterium]